MKQLGSTVIDRVTGLVGVVTHLLIEMDGARKYIFQPRGLNPKTGQPVDSIWAASNRFDDVEVPDVGLPTHVLGTQVTDDASGFTGTAISLFLHINGCVHFDVQPKGLQENGAPIAACNFDIRRLRGDAIKSLTPTEKVESQTRNPSPAGMPPQRSTKI